jgi:hypothetical protein
MVSLNALITYPQRVPALMCSFVAAVSSLRYSVIIPKTNSQDKPLNQKSHSFLWL